MSSGVSAQLHQRRHMALSAWMPPRIQRCRRLTLTMLLLLAWREGLGVCCPGRVMIETVSHLAWLPHAVLLLARVRAHALGAGQRGEMGCGAPGGAQFC